ncbi:MAG: hypothetical protein KJ069_22990 [Anaerolineae bacterium]|nr:hypothetical protein [Anaerolineae bacterium]
MNQVLRIPQNNVLLWGKGMVGNASRSLPLGMLRLDLILLWQAGAGINGLTEIRKNIMNNELTIIEQSDIIFCNDELTAVRGNDSKVYVSVTQMCPA